MAKEVLMPRQGNTVESCIILGWKKREGEKVSAADIICEVETDKAAFEVEAGADGTLLLILHPEGADVPVLSPIAVIGEPGEDVSAWTGAGSGQAAAASAEVVPQKRPEEPASAAVPEPEGYRTADGVRISPRARNLAKARGADLSGVDGSGPGGRIIVRDVLRHLGGGTLSEGDVAREIDRQLAAPSAAGAGAARTAAGPGAGASAAAAAFPGPTHDIPVKSVRKVIAKRMLESLTTTAQLTLNASADAGALLDYRKRLKASPEQMGLSGITINDLVLFAVARTLPRFRYLNAHFLGETIREFEAVHLGFAVDTPRGLMVPVIRNADRLSLREISAEAKRLAERCLAGSASQEELSGGTFSVTNLGSLGIESFTPVLDPPQVGILGICAITPKPVIRDGETRFLPHLGLSLTFDHRAVDGAPAARFVKELTEVLARIDLALAG